SRLSSRSIMIAAAVKVLVIEPTRYCVCGVASAPDSMSAIPTASAQTTRPLQNAAALRLGSRLLACSPRIRRVGSPAADKDAARLRDLRDRLFDVAAGHVEGRYRTQDARVDGRRQADSVRRQPPEPLRGREAELAHPQLDEVRLDGLGLDRHA